VRFTLTSRRVQLRSLRLRQRRGRHGRRPAPGMATPGGPKLPASRRPAPRYRRPSRPGCSATGLGCLSVGRFRSGARHGRPDCRGGTLHLPVTLSPRPVTLSPPPRSRQRGFRPGPARRLKDASGSDAPVGGICRGQMARTVERHRRYEAEPSRCARGRNPPKTGQREQPGSSRVAGSASRAVSDGRRGAAAMARVTPTGCDGTRRDATGRDGTRRDAAGLRSAWSGEAPTGSSRGSSSCVPAAGS
jgi:hypothetical protein